MMSQNIKLHLITLVLMIIIQPDIIVYGALNSTELNDIKNSVVNNLPEGITLPPELKDLDVGEGIKQASDIFKQKCIENSGSDAAFEEASQALSTLMECVQNIIDFGNIQQEIEEAKPNGNLDTVFNKYCNKRNDGVACVDKFTSSIDPCLTQEEKNQKTVFINITKSLLEFVCHENGNQIALFIAEEGPECFESKRDNLISCFNKTMGKYFKDEVPTLENLPTLVIKDENCVDMDNLEECVVFELEQCKESTPANLVEALFRFVRKETPCGKKKTASNPNSSENVKLSITLFGTWMIITTTIKMIYQ
ncbi:27 kDa glycoprotein-like [Chironomus tepperi]|uniref:27 kDa glycoprotein-like n=1 Tax=Chironomus tepperi TaxID=113505 RepID=UPI00391FA917